MPRARQSFVRVAAVCLLVGGFSASQASASPITMNFTGLFHYWDLGMHESDPSELAFETAFAAYGVLSAGCSSQGCYSTSSPILLSLTVDPSGPSVSSWIPGAILAGTFDIGPLRYVMDPIGPLSALAGPTISANGYTFAPQWADILDSGPSAVIAFDYHWLNAHSFRLVSVSVPEPDSLVALSGALLAFVAKGVHIRRRRATPSGRLSPPARNTCTPSPTCN